MMNIPENVLRIIVEAVRKYPGDIPKAVAEADVGVRALPEFDSLINSLLRDAIQEVAYDTEHKIKINVKMNRKAVHSRVKAKARGPSASDTGKRKTTEPHQP